MTSEWGPHLVGREYLTAFLVVHLCYVLHTVGQYERWQQYCTTGGKIHAKDTNYWYSTYTYVKIQRFAQQDVPYDTVVVLRIIFDIAAASRRRRASS